MLKPTEYLSTPPTWASESAKTEYDAALAKFSLVLGRNPSRLCPVDDHHGSEDLNIVAYSSGVMCYSQHGFMPKAKVIEMAGMNADAAKFSLVDLAEKEVGRFVAEDQLESLLAAGVAERLGWTEPRARAAVNCLISWAKRHHLDDEWWSQRLEAVLNGEYPRQAHEFWSSNGIVHRRHHAPSAIESLSASTRSYTVRILEPREKPGPPLAIKLAPKLAAISDQGKASASAGTDRFLAGESAAVAQSSLTAVECVDRPVPTLQGGWKLPENANELPRLVEIARTTVEHANNANVLEELFDDLRKTFAFADDEAFARYVAYLIQPMLVVFMPGLFPGYMFTGPTRSGKNFLAGAFPSEIYRHNAGDPVFATRFPASDYELAVQLAAHQGTLYALFDEVIDLTEAQLKILDSLITSGMLISRKMRVGYLTRPNYLTFAMTAIAKALPPETAGRVLDVHLTESRPAEIHEFFKRWRGRGAEVLRALFEALAAVEDLRQGDPVPERRPGFGVLKRVLREAFGLEATFSISADEDEVLDLICQGHFHNLGTVRDGNWRRISFTALAKLYTETFGTKLKKNTMVQKVHTALGHESTSQHPVYGKTGYLWEDKKAYEIEIRSESEGSGLRRQSVYVREMKSTAQPPPPEPQESPSPGPAVVPAAEPDCDLPAEAAAEHADADVLEFDAAALEQQMAHGGEPHV